MQRICEIHAAFDPVQGLGHDQGIVIGHAGQATKCAQCTRDVRCPLAVRAAQDLFRLQQNRHRNENGFGIHQGTRPAGLVRVSALATTIFVSIALAGLGQNSGVHAFKRHRPATCRKEPKDLIRRRGRESWGPERLRQARSCPFHRPDQLRQRGHLQRRIKAQAAPIRQQ